MKWYAVYVETGMEEQVLKALRRRFSPDELLAVVPKRRLTERRAGHMHEVLKTMFPGYVLIRTEMDTAKYYAIQSTPHCFRILKNKDSYYTPILPHEIEMLARLWDTSGILEPSQAMLINSRAVVMSGPLQGLEGLITHIDKRKNRAKISVSFLGSQRVIDVGIQILESVPSLV